MIKGASYWSLEQYVVNIVFVRVILAANELKTYYLPYLC